LIHYPLDEFIVISYLSAKDTNSGFVFILSGGRAATLSVLYHLNSRDSLFRNTHGTSISATAICLDTTVEPSQMFGGGVGNQSTAPTGKNRLPEGCEQPVPAVEDGMSLSYRSEYGYVQEQTCEHCAHECADEKVADCRRWDM